ncbi:hypothetical protein [Cellulophaga sp. Hel_I_12]|uniref:hypothetical protein n=1 Tax=Cellulophaga sp. Hel_I_12 TaxID=1249972 RepID=UPI00064562D6|nr:hypothetical protein [Cellulophaga sp. Hel_I_12]
MNVKQYITLLPFSLFLFSCDDILEVDDISAAEVQILAPKDGTIIASNTVSFNWDELNSAEAYRIQIAQPNFENAVQILMDSTVIQDTLGRVITSIEKRLLNGVYQWRIKAINSGYETPYVSFGFEIDGDVNADIIPPNNPVLAAPANGSTEPETLVNFSWTRENIAGTAERDSIFIYQTEDLQTLESKNIGTDKTFTATLTSGETYYWRVKAYDAFNESNFSNVFSVTIN